MKTRSCRKLRLTHLTTLAVAMASLARGQTSAPPPGTDEPLSLAAFQVTGSNLKAGESEGSSNLRIFDAAAIEHSGVDTLPALLQKLPEIGFGGFAENQINTSSPGTAAISLRGLGANSNLVLLNGRRVTSSPFARNPGAGSAGSLGTMSFVDLNMIPVSAIARIDVLKDGASAIYGADAVSGVVNIILREDYQGSKVTASYGNFTNHGIDAPTYRASLISGAAQDGRSVTVSLDYLKREGIFYSELPIGLKSLNGASNPGTFVVPVGGRNPITAATLTAPATFFVVPGGSSGNVQFSTTTAPNSGNLSDIVGPIGVQPPSERLGAFASITQKFTSLISGFAEFTYSRVKSNESFSPASISNLNNVLLPANAVFNPFGVALNSNQSGSPGSLRYRFTELGPRYTDTTSDFYRLVGGVRGKIGATWDWEASALWNPSNTTATYRAWPSQDRVSAALASSDPATALNLFTTGSVRNTPAALAALESGVQRKGETRLTSFAAKASGNVYDLPSGPIALATGVEYRRETFDDRRTQIQLLGQAFPPPPAVGSRTVKSAYAETRIPIIGAAQNVSFMHAAEINLAVRSEKFDTSGVGTATKPRVGIRLQPIEDLTLRGSWGEGFRAPSLTELFLPQSTGGLPIIDPLRFGKPGSDSGPGGIDTNTNRTVTVGGNPNLQPEKSKSYNLGVQYSPKFIKGFSASIDYYHIKVTNSIGSPTTDYLLNNASLFPGQVIRAPQTPSDIANNLPGVLIGYSTILSNLGYVETDGWDFSTQYRLPLKTIGTFTFNAGATYTSNYTVQLQANRPPTEQIGTYENPRVRGNTSVFWSLGPWGAGTTLNYVGPFAEVTGANRRVASQTTFDLQASRDLPAGFRATLGINNVFDRLPPAVSQTSSITGYAERTNTWQPRFAYLEISKKF